MTPSIEVMIADDQPMILEGFVLQLRRQDDLLVTGTAQGGAELLELVAQRPPHVVIVDVHMPRMDGAAVAEKLQQAHPHIGILALSMYDDHALVGKMMSAGALGYVLKSEQREDLLRGIRMVAQGILYLSPKAALAAARRLTQWNLKDEGQLPKPLLTTREQEVLALIFQEFTTEEICRELHLGTSTVNSYRKSLLEKTGARNTAGLVRYAIKAGLVRDEGW